MMPVLIEHIHKSYGDKTVLRDFSCCFEPGRAYCICGPSGSGKTTLLRLVCGLEAPDSGAISGMKGKKISAVFQEDRLLENLSAEKNIMLTARSGFSASEAAHLLSRLGIADVKKPAGAFSGGMKRRCAVARALAAEYDMLILDEPLTGLDEVSRKAVLQAIRDESAGKTLLCATHSTDFADFFSAETVLIPSIQTEG